MRVRSVCLVSPLLALALGVVAGCADVGGQADGASRAASATFSASGGARPFGVVRSVPFCAARLESCEFERVRAGAIDARRHAILAVDGAPLLDFDSSGAPRGQFGVDAQVAGSADYRSICVDGASRYVAVNLARLRVERYDAAGRLLDTLRLPSRLGITDVLGSCDGAVLVLVPPGDSVGAWVDGELQSVRWGGRPAAGRASRAQFRARAVAAKGADLIPMQPFFRPRTLWAAGAGGDITVADGGSGDLLRLAVGGAATVIHTGIEPVSVRGADLARERERVLAYFTGEWRARTLPIVDVASRRAERYFPRVSSLVRGGDGAFWVGTTPGPRDSVRWGRLSADGQWTLSLTLPDSVTILDGTETRILTVRRLPNRKERVQWHDIAPLTADEPSEVPRPVR